MGESVFILGVGRNTASILDLVEDCNFRVEGLLHYNTERIGELFSGYTINGCSEEWLEKPSLAGMNFVLSMGDIPVRKELYERIIARGGSFPSLIHPTAIVSKRAHLGNGVLIMPQSIVQADVCIGDNTVITMNSTIAHSTTIGSHCFISGHSLIGAYMQIEDEVMIGQGCTLVSGAVNVVGRNSVLGAGSVLRADMKPNAVYLGNPARFMKEREV